MMLLLIHITIALLGLVEGTMAVMRPSEVKLKITSLLLFGTVITGVYLVWVTNAPVVSSCISGVAYIGITGVLQVIARHRLAQRI